MLRAARFMELVSVVRMRRSEMVENNMEGRVAKLERLSWLRIKTLLDFKYTFLEERLQRKTIPEILPSNQRWLYRPT
jgi:hypothetical protein